MKDNYRNENSESGHIFGRIENESEKVEKRRGIVTAEELLNNDIKEVPMLWGYFLPRTGISLLAGNSDTGKSTLVRQLCSAIVTGQGSFLSHELYPAFGSVIYVSTEDDYSSLSARFKKENQSATDAGGYENFRYVFDYKEEELTSFIDEELSKFPADCVVIDALGDVITTDPNNIVNVRKFYSAYKKITDKHGCLVLFVHHNRKSSLETNPSKSDVSGSQALEAKPRAVLMLSNVRGVANSKELRLVKGNYVTEGMKNYPLFIDVDEYGKYICSETERAENQRKKLQNDFISPDQKVYNDIKRFHEEGMSFREIESIMREYGTPISRSTMSRWLGKNE